MTHRRILWIPLLLLLLFFTSCDTADITADDPAQTADTTPAPVTASIDALSDMPSENRLCTDLLTVKQVTLAIPDELFVYDLRAVQTQGETIILPGSVSDGRAYARYDSTGTFQGITDPITPAEDAHKTAIHLPLADGGILTVLPMDDSGCHTAVFLDAAGEVIAEHLLPPGSGDDLLLLDNGNLSVYTGSHVTVFSPDGETVLQTECDNRHGKPTKGPDNTLYFSDAPNEKAYYMIDPDTADFHLSDIYKKPDTVDRSAQLKFDAAGSAYLIDKTAVWAYDPAGETVTPMMEWNRTDYAFDSTTVLAVLDAKTYLIRMTDPLTNEPTLQILSVQDTDAAPKTEIRLGLLDYSTEPQLLGKLISGFNRSSQDYHVTLTVYEPDKDGLALSKLEEDLLWGDAPDIIIFGTNSMTTYRDLANKDLFFDLNPYFFPQLIPGVADGYAADGKLYLLPANFRLYTLASLTALLPDADTLSIDTLAAYMENCSQDTVPFSAEPNDAGTFLGFRFLGTALQSFYDMDTGICSFDCPAFETLLSLHRSIADRLDTKNPCFLYDNGDASVPNLTEMLATGQLAFLEVPLSSTTQYMRTKRWFSDADIRFWGYPTKDGHAAYIESDLSFAVIQNTTVPRGAMTFLQYILSDAVQNSNAVSMRAFPVTHDALENSLTSQRYFYYLPAPDTNAGQSRYSGGYVGSLPEPMDAQMMERGGYEEVHMTDEDLAVLRAMFYEMPQYTLCDSTIEEIVLEEIAAYSAGVRDARACADIVQSRVSIYLAEKQ